MPTLASDSEARNFWPTKSVNSGSLGTEHFLEEKEMVEHVWKQQRTNKDKVTSKFIGNTEHILIIMAVAETALEEAK